MSALVQFIFTCFGCAYASHGGLAKSNHSVLANLYQPNSAGKVAKVLPLVCREGTEGKSLSINPGTRGTKEVYLNILHKVRGQADKKVSVKKAC